MPVLAAAEAEESEAEATDNAELYRDDAESSIPDALALPVKELAEATAFWRF